MQSLFNRPIRVAALLALATGLARGQKVTADAMVKIDGRFQKVRKINGRWWSEDNRQLTPSKDVSWIWWITKDLKAGGVMFYHHRPVDLVRAESLHLFMDPQAVRSLLGDPNEVQEKAGFWWYYAENGTALFLRFFKQELGEARYERPEYGVSGRRVRSIERELNGRSIFQIMADRAWQKRSPASYAKAKGHGGLRGTW